MRFLVVTDIHGKQSATEWINFVIKENKVDCVLALGDISNFGPDDVAAKILDSIDSAVYAIPGNCDPLTIPSVIAKHGTDMHGKSAEIGGIYVAGLGGSNPTIFNTPFELSEEDIYNNLKGISKKGMILMVHAPPYGINDTIPSGLHVGSISIMKIVREFKPLLVLSGHIHEAIGCVKEGGITFVNPGPAKDGYSAIVDIENDTVSVKMLSPLD